MISWKLLRNFCKKNILVESIRDFWKIEKKLKKFIEIYLFVYFLQINFQKIMYLVKNLAGKIWGGGARVPPRIGSLMCTVYEYS